MRRLESTKRFFRLIDAANQIDEKGLRVVGEQPPAAAPTNNKVIYHSPLACKLRPPKIIAYSLC